jgi:hypothetical protein
MSGLFREMAGKLERWVESQRDGWKDRDMGGQIRELGGKLERCGWKDRGILDGWKFV